MTDKEIFARLAEDIKRLYLPPIPEKVLEVMRQQKKPYDKAFDDCKQNTT